MLLSLGTVRKKQAENMRYGEGERESIEEEGDSVPGEPRRVCGEE